MIKIFFLILTLGLYSHAHISVTQLQYEGGISLYGKVGIADVELIENFSNNTYKIKITTKSIGLVNKLSSNREDLYLSEGNIDNNTYIPEKFTKLVRKDDYYEKTTYTFDYKNKKIIKSEILKEVKYIYKFDVDIMNFTKKKTLVEKIKTKNIDFINNDFLTLFLNLRKGNINNGPISYIDKNKKSDLNLINPNLFEIQKDNGNSIYRIGFKNDNSLFIQEAVAKDIAFYGDAYVKKVYEETKVLFEERLDKSLNLWFTRSLLLYNS